MTHAYNQLYIAKTSRAVGNMLHYAVKEQGLDGSDFLNRFIQSGIAKEIENGNPMYIAGKSGIELCCDVIERTEGRQTDYSDTEVTFERDCVYWVGWVLTHYQWYSRRTFESILEIIPYDELCSLYPILHEADIQKSYEVFDMHFKSAQSKLKAIRQHCGLTQEQLAQKSSVSLNTIRAYERKSKDISKAQFNIITKLCDALKCEPAALI